MIWAHWPWVVAWAIAVAVLFYVRPRTAGPVNKIVAMLLVTLLGGAALVVLYAFVLMTA